MTQITNGCHPSENANCSRYGCKNHADIMIKTVFSHDTNLFCSGCATEMYRLGLTVVETRRKANVNITDEEWTIEFTRDQLLLQLSNVRDFISDESGKFN